MCPLKTCVVTCNAKIITLTILYNLNQTKFMEKSSIFTISSMEFQIVILQILYNIGCDYVILKLRILRVIFCKTKSIDSKLQNNPKWHKVTKRSDNSRIDTGSICTKKLAATII